MQKLVKYFKGFKNKGFNATDKIIKKAIYLMRYNPLCWKWKLHTTRIQLKYTI